MSMNDINAAAAAQNALTARIGAFVDDANAQVGEVAGRYNADFAGIYVDQALGNNDHAGTQEAPVATIGRACDLVPAGVNGNIYVRGNYTTTERYYSGGKNIALHGMVGSGSEFHHPANEVDRPVLTISTKIYADQAWVNGFSPELGSVWNVSNFQVKLPAVSDLSQAVIDAESTPTTRAVFTVRTSSRVPFGTAILRYCNITIPDDLWGTIISRHTGTRFELLSCTLDGSLAGHVHPHVPAGTLSADAFPYVTTNLASL